MIVNLTQHPASAEQIAAGVVDIKGEQHQRLVKALTFNDLPSEEEIICAAETIAEVAILNGLGGQFTHLPVESAMIGGALWLMAPLAAVLKRRGIQPLFAFSKRESDEVPQDDGSVKKVQIFRHIGFVDAV